MAFRVLSQRCSSIYDPKNLVQNMHRFAFLSKLKVKSALNKGLFQVLRWKIKILGLNYQNQENSLEVLLILTNHRLRKNQWKLRNRNEYDNTSTSTKSITLQIGDDTSILQVGIGTGLLKRDKSLKISLGKLFTILLLNHHKSLLDKPCSYSSLL